jgi:DDE superfamily endonuclease
LENRYKNDVFKQRSLMTIDGVDFKIPEPIPFDEMWFSHKFNGPGLRYEIAVAINTGDIVWFNGPFPAGAFPDLKIFRSALKYHLDAGEMVVADRGYVGEPRIYTPDYPRNYSHKNFMRRARARHEAINRMMKTFQCLKQVNRHGRHKHHLLFQSVLVLTQICIQNGRRPFQVANVHDPALPSQC